MKEKFLLNSMSFIKKYKKYSDDEVEKIQYGLEGLYLTISKLIVIIFISIVLGIFKEILIVLLFFNIIRYPAFGAHADKSYTCLILSIVLIIGLTFISLRINLNDFFKILICFVTFINFILFAPADTHKRPMTNPKKRKYRKLASCLVVIIYSVLIIFANSYFSQLILVALIIEALMINPVIYKIMGLPFNNYKNLV